MPEPKPSLHKKLAQVMYEAERIPKNGVAPPAMGSFRFVQVGDAADAIRKALAEKSVSMIPTAVEIVGETEHLTSQQKTMTTLTVRTTWTLTDGDSGESIVIQSLGSGADTGDKAAPKAQSNAMKYALLMGFLLSTGDDPEQSDTSDRGQRTPLAAREPSPTEPATLRPEGREQETFLGILTKSGVIRKGGGEGYKLERRETADGPTFGFRLELSEPEESGGHKAIPQVLVPPPVAVPLLAHLDRGDPLTLEKRTVRVKGHLYQVSHPGRQSYYRLLVQEWKDDEREIPSKEALPDAGFFGSEPPDDVRLIGEKP